MALSLSSLMEDWQKKQEGARLANLKGHVLLILKGLNKLLLFMMRL